MCIIHYYALKSTFERIPMYEIWYKIIIIMIIIITIIIIIIIQHCIVY